MLAIMNLSRLSSGGNGRAWPVQHNLNTAKSQRRLHRLELLWPDGVGVAVAPFGQDHLCVFVEAGLVKGDTLRRQRQAGELGARQRIAQLRAVTARRLL